MKVVSPTVNHIPTGTKLPQEFTAFIRGQMVFEAILSKLIETTLESNHNFKHWEWSFHKKKEAAYHRGLIDYVTYNLMGMVGKIRNRIVHQLELELNHEEVYELAWYVVHHMDGDMTDGFSPSSEIDTCYGSITEIDTVSLVEDIFKHGCDYIMFEIDDDLNTGNCFYSGDWEDLKKGIKCKNPKNKKEYEDDLFYCVE